MGFQIISSYEFEKNIDKNLPSLFFDLDHTIIFPKNNKKFFSKTDSSDFIFRPYIFNILNLTINKYTVYIITNQLKYDKIIKNRIIMVSKILTQNIPNFNFCICISTDRDYYRKPGPGFSVEQNIPGGIPTIIKSKSFHCGDAGGREKDFSDDDLWFANHAGIQFFTPEKVFDKEFKFGKVNPYKPPNIKINTNLIHDLKKIYSKYDGLILVGLPGSGKSYVRNWFISNLDNSKNIIVWNKDEDLPHIKDKKFYKQQDNLFHIFDNTNLRVSDRDIKGINCATMYIDIDRLEAIRGVKYRTIMEGGLYIPDIVINTMNKYKAPPLNPEILLKNQRPILDINFPPYLLI